MKITVLTNEYPPHVYGGAGVHVEYLARELAAADEGAHQVDVHCFGEQRADAGPRGNLRVRGVPAPAEANASWRGLSCASLMSSGTDCTGSEGVTTST